VIDTEFCQFTFFTGPYRKGNRPITANHIFDIAIINLVDPYRSIIAAVKPIDMNKVEGMSQAKMDKMLKENIDKAMRWITAHDSNSNSDQSEPYDSMSSPGSTPRELFELDRKSTRLNSSHPSRSRMPSSA